MAQPQRRRSSFEIPMHRRSSFEMARARVSMDGRATRSASKQLVVNQRGSERLSIAADPVIREILQAEKNEKALRKAEQKEASGVRFSIAEVEDNLGDQQDEDGWSFADSADEREFEAQSRKTCNGLLIDFIFRLKAQKEHGAEQDPHTDAVKSMASLMNVDEAPKEPTSESLSHRDEHVQEGYLAAVLHVNHEMLHSSLMADIVEFWKNSKAPGWEYDAKGWQKRAKDIAKFKTQVRCLRHEVKQWALKKKFMISKVGYMSESQGERHTRHQEFWAQFHEESTRVDMAPPFKETDASLRAQNNQTKSGYPRGSDRRQRSTPTSKGTSASSDMAWKMRPTRSRVTAGTWDWTRGQEGTVRTLSKKSGKTSAKWTFDEAPEDFPLDASVVGPWSAVEASGDGNFYSTFPASTPSGVGKPSHRWWKALQPPEATQSPFMKTYEGNSVNLPKSTSLPSLCKQSPRHIRRAGLSDRSLELLDLSSESPLPGKEAPLPPITPAFSVPWHGKQQSPLLKMEDTPTKKYLRACASSGNMPRPIPFVTGHSLKLATKGESMNDNDLAAVTVMLQDSSNGVEEIDLEGNVILTDKSLNKFTKTLFGSKSLKMLSLKGCRRAGQGVLTNLVKLLSIDDGVQNLQELNLSSIAIWNQSHLPLARAIKNHPKLKHFYYADTGLGESVHCVECIDLILGSTTIQTLDLGWNCFDEEAFTRLGEKLTEMSILRSLSIANCSASGKPDHASPIVFFFEQLSRDFTLRKLDASLNRIDFRGALVLEDSLENSRRLADLNVSSNPLGVLGMRCLLRLLSRNESGLMYFNCDDCNNSSGISEGGETALERYQVFSATNPGGRYKLELARPYHRSLLRMLYKTCEKFKLPPDMAFSDIIASPAYSHPTKDSFGAYAMPTAGKLSVTFSVDKAMEDAMKNISPGDFSTFIDRHFEMMRVQPGFRKVVPLFAQWASVDGRTLVQHVMLDALSKDFRLSYTHLDQLAMSRAVIPEILARLMPCLKGGELARYLTFLLLPSVGEFVKLLERVRKLLTFNIENPNGHYVLDLSNPAEHSVAEQLLLLDRFECMIARQQKRMDVSQRGNYSQVRNERYQHRRLPVNSVAEWNLPEFDILELDYSSGKRCTGSEKTLDEITFANILVTLQQSDCSHLEQIQALRCCSHAIYIKSVQLRGLLGIYAAEEARAEIFVLFFLRVVDFYNEKVFRVRFTKESELHALNHRIGWVSLLPFMQPEQATFLLDFANYDQRLAANVILWLTGKESPVNIRDPQFVFEDGTEDPLPQGVPRSWETFEKMPKSGVLKMSYMCSPEDRNFKARKHLYESYGFRKCPPDEKDVMWWAALNEAPEDVLEYLEFLIAKFENPAKAFKIIDGDDGNGVISLREFEEGYKEMECTKFKGKDELARVHSVFRYLDPSGEGQVSEEEWGMLCLLEKEIKLSITEFVQFCERTFGPDLSHTWNYLDDDGSGEIDEDEWCSAVSKVGFFGPAKPIFNFLDKDDEGTVSLDEFEELESFQTKPGAGSDSGSRPCSPASLQSNRPVSQQSIR